MFLITDCHLVNKKHHLPKIVELSSWCKISPTYDTLWLCIIKRCHFIKTIPKTGNDKQINNFNQANPIGGMKSKPHLSWRWETHRLIRGVPFLYRFAWKRMSSQTSSSCRSVCGDPSTRSLEVRWTHAQCLAFHTVCAQRIQPPQKLITKSADDQIKTSDDQFTRCMHPKTILLKIYFPKNEAHSWS